MNLAKIIFLGVFFSASFALASPIPVAVQCSIEGPIYAGTLDFQMDMHQWKSTGDCRPGGWQMFAAPHFELTFNNLTYVNASNADVQVVFENVACDISTARPPGFTISETKSQRPARLALGAATDGRVPSVFEIEATDGDPEICTVSVPQ